ncbi:hypothetical protein LOTGIDRAFT_67410, partial [Lottia gigantea]
IILLGKSGIGKSSFGNYLLRAQKFRTRELEDGETEECQIERTDSMVVVDTPGFFSKYRSDVDVGKEIMETIRVNNLSINVYILVLGADRKVTQSSIDSVEFIKKLFGEKVINNMIIVFTGKHDKNKFRFSEYLPRIPYFLLDCKH